MKSLEKRIEELERSTGKSAQGHAMVVEFVTPGVEPSEIRSLTRNGQRWERGEGESEDVFIGRATAEAKRLPNCGVVLVAGHV